MTTTLALVALFDAVVDAFKVDGTPIPNTFGWRAPTLQKTSTVGSIAWVPGDPQGDAGILGAPVKSGRLPDRPLATLGEVFTVYIHGVDGSTKEALADERSQYIAARCLFDYWYKTVYNAGYKIGSGSRIAMPKLAWLVDKKERQHGACLRATMIIQAAVFDTTVSVTTLPVDANLDTGIAATGGDITTDDGEVSITSDPTIP